MTEYALNPVVREDPPGMTDLDLFESLLGCQSIEELHATTARIAKHLGFEHFVYGVNVNVSLTRPYQFFLSGYPKEWWKHYTDSDYKKIDPIVRHAAEKVIPVIWDKRLSSTPPAEKFMGEAKEFGLANGASFPVHGRRGEFSALNLATSRDSREAKQDIVAAMGKAQLLACYVHEAVQRIVLSKGPLPVEKTKLTEREKECLLWAADGKTSWEISQIVKISEHTVVFHLRNVVRKMGVTNRRQAVARAVSMGLMNP
jgi:LuxR family transcriptional activator of bioluminescence operon/LuxR family quorum-sensing transcriptional regulator LasR